MFKKEEWKDIDGYEGYYQVSNMGRIKSLERKAYYNNCYRPIRERILKPNKSDTGYMTVSLFKNGKQKTFNVSRLVVIHFIPNPENKPQVNHKNGIKKDNRVENLEWNTRLENVRHAISIGLVNQKGEKSYFAKLTERHVKDIRFLDENKINHNNISKLYYVSANHVYGIVKRIYWKHI